MKYVLALLMILTGCMASVPVRTFTPADRAAILGVLDAQAEAWNRGDLPAYMAGYAHTDTLVFTSGGKIRRGWQTAFDSFQQRYAKDPKAMGTLKFSMVSVEPLGADGAVVLGSWQLDGSPNDGSGVFSLVWARRPEGWRVIHDHTSLVPPPASSTASSWTVPAGWRSETLAFPLDFAPTIQHRGSEQLRFPPGFFDPSKPAYWSYTFTWRTEDPAALDSAALGRELTAYFRGLLDAVDQPRRRFPRDQVEAQALAAGPGRFLLKAHLFDAFDKTQRKTLQPIELHGWAERRQCQNGALWVFVLAPATTGIGPQLDELALSAGC